MSEDLVEELARRLWKVVQYPSGQAPEWGGTSRASREYWTAAARECLRQMRWQLIVVGQVTRQIGPEAKEVPVLYWEQWARILETGPLTLAPEDWQP